MGWFSSFVSNPIGTVVNTVQNVVSNPVAAVGKVVEAVPGTKQDAVTLAKVAAAVAATQGTGLTSVLGSTAAGAVNTAMTLNSLASALQSAKAKPAAQWTAAERAAIEEEQRQVDALKARLAQGAPVEDSAAKLGGALGVSALALMVIV